jgi:hypothetical protein
MSSAKNTELEKRSGHERGRCRECLDGSHVSSTLCNWKHGGCGTYLRAADQNEMSLSARQFVLGCSQFVSFL